MSNPTKIQEELERLFSKNQLIPRITKEFKDCKSFDFPKYLDDCGIPYKFGMTLIVQMALHKRTNLQTLIGLLRHTCDDSQQAADLLERAITHKLVMYDDQLEQFIVMFTISDEVQAELDQFQYPLPMVVKPMIVEKNTETGYLLNKGSIILKDNHHDNDVCLDHINRVNRIAFTVNEDTATMIKNRWRNLDKPKEGESKSDFKRRCAAFDKYDRTAHAVINLMVQVGNRFFLTHKYDKRGRVYCQGYHINYQGNPWNKAVLELVDKELIA